MNNYGESDFGIGEEILFQEVDTWSEKFRKVSSSPLKFCPEFPRITSRHEAWWRGELEGPPLFLANPVPAKRAPPTGIAEMLENPQEWLDNSYRRLELLKYFGDSIPYVRANFGPCMLGALFGGRTEISSGTTWTHKMISDDWSNMPRNIIEEHPWWKLLSEIIEITARRAKGNFIVCTPSLGGSADILLNLRGTEELAMDVFDQPEKISRSVEDLYHAWRQSFKMLFDIATGNGAGLINWVALWSDKPYIATECDFSYMISEEHFESLFLPDIARQSAAVGRSIFHLDGPGSTRHIDALLEIPEMQAIQYVPGAGNSALAKIDMLKRIQEKGRSLQVTAPASEVVELSERLEPNSLAIWVAESLADDKYENLYSQMVRRW